MVKSWDSGRRTPPAWVEKLIIEKLITLDKSYRHKTLEERAARFDSKLLLDGEGDFMELLTYEDKMKRIFDCSLEANGDNQRAIENVKIWLQGEWLCGGIDDMYEYNRLKEVADKIAAEKIKLL